MSGFPTVCHKCGARKRDTFVLLVHLTVCGNVRLSPRRNRDDH